jgi:hypothetical protein
LHGIGAEIEKIEAEQNAAVSESRDSESGSSRERGIQTTPTNRRTPWSRGWGRAARTNVEELGRIDNENQMEKMPADKSVSLLQKG